MGTGGIQGTTGFALSESWIKKRAELTQGTRAAHTDPTFGAMALGRYSPSMLCGEEGDCSGIMVLDKRQLSDTDLSGKKENSHRFIQATYCT